MSIKGKLSKQEVIDALIKDESISKNFKRSILVLEFNKKSSSLGIIKGELLENDNKKIKIKLKGGLAVYPDSSDESFYDWEKMKVGDIRYAAFFIDSQGKTMGGYAKKLLNIITKSLNLNVPFKVN